MKVIDGGVTAPKGFLAASTAAGIKYKDRSDMAMIYSTVPCKAAGTFTTNVVKAAPVLYDKKIVTESKSVQAVVVNAGIANACTGEEGFGYCRATAKAAAETLNVDEISLQPGDIVFEGGDNSEDSIEHVQIYAGKNSNGENVWYNCGDTTAMEAKPGEDTFSNPSKDKHYITYVYRKVDILR